MQAKAKTQKAAAGGIAPAGKNLMEIYLAHAGLLSQRGFGNIPLPEQLVQQLADAVIDEILLVIG